MKETPKRVLLRRQRMTESELPYCFIYKMRKAFSGKICPVCGYVMRNYLNAPHGPSIQHNKTITKGGRHEIANISIICCSCNKKIRDKETKKLNNSMVIKIWATLV